MQQIRTRGARQLQSRGILGLFRSSKRNGPSLPLEPKPSDVPRGIPPMGNEYFREGPLGKPTKKRLPEITSALEVRASTLSHPAGWQCCRVPTQSEPRSARMAMSRVTVGSKNIALPAECGHYKRCARKRLSRHAGGVRTRTRCRRRGLTRPLLDWAR